MNTYGRGRGRRHSHGGFGRFGAFDPAIGFEFFGHGSGGYGRGMRARRGNIRAGILALLAEAPRNGYQIIQELRQRSEGMWRPSPGSVYPTLQQLEDEGLIEAAAAESGKRRLYRLTDEGRTYVDERTEELAAPWEAVTDSVSDDIHEFFTLMRQVGMAAIQVGQAGSPAQLEQAKETLVEARRKLYRILAEDEPAD